MSNGKGDGRRPTFVPPAVADANWAGLDWGNYPSASPRRDRAVTLQVLGGCSCGGMVFVEDHAGKRCFLCGMRAR